ncbi:TonB-dependent receptor [Sphingomonas profundi]|uniref:TonB-dependent receptor n=1 Tax=Alterirhizorhabdus profundi TaxID=2681549 RepID=UPI0012E97BFB|nr:TonB-dependent receptor [Sphingomonas profundi]
MARAQTWNRYSIALSLGTAVAALVGVSGNAHAQDVAAAVTPSGDSIADKPTADDGSIQDIVVSARRRDETLQTTPIAITAIAPAQLEAKATLNIGDLQGAAPNVLITNQNSGAAAANVSIRGLSFADIDKSFDPTVGIMVDGVFIGTNTGAYLDFFDISSIEILRGPQGTLFGRNTIGGVINIQRTKPTGEFGGKFEASYGRFNTWAGRGVLNAPIVPDVLAAKLFYFHNESDGYYRNAMTGRRTGASNNENFGGSLLFTPSSDFASLLTLEKQVQDFVPVNSNISKTGELFCLLEPANECDRNTTTDLYTVFVSPTSSHYTAPAVTWQNDLDLDFTKLTSITSYRSAKEQQTQDFDSSSVDIYYSNRRQKFHQVSQELRAAGKFTDNFDYVIGGYFYSSRYELLQRTRITLFAPPRITEQNTIGHSQSYAVFGDFNLSITDRLRLSFGGRYTHDRKKNRNRVDADQFPGVTYNGSKFTPKVEVDYRPNEQIMAYASWSRGYRSGGFSGRGTTLVSSTTPYGPETVDSYEIGLKMALFDRKLLFNIDAFYADYNSLQQSTTVPTSTGVGNETIVTNVGSAKIKGIEADFTARPVDRLTFTGSIGYLENGFKNFITQGAISALQPAVRTIDYSNVNLIYAPKITAAINAEYSVPTDFGKVQANVGYRYIARYDQQIGLDATAAYPPTGTVVIPRNDPRVRSDEQNLLDVSLSAQFAVEDRKVRVTAYTRNLLDDRGPNAAFTVAGLWSFSSAREPRTYGVQLGVEF